MNASTLSIKNDQQELLEPSNLPTSFGDSDSDDSPAAGHVQHETQDKTISRRLLSFTMPKGDAGDTDALLNPITESSGSDHHSDSQNSSRPSSRPRSSSDTHLHRQSVTTYSRSPGANGEEHRSQSLSLSKSSGLQCLVSDTPQPIASSSSAPSTPLKGNNQTHSFVFTSSRQPQILGGETLIGVVNPSIGKALALPKQSSLVPKQQRKSTLTPEQIRAHALGAVHAISENSPFHSVENARPSAVAQMDLPLQTPMISENVDPIDRSLQRHGIDFYVNAARQGRNKMPQTNGPPLPPSNVRSFSHATSLESLGEDTGQAAFGGLPSPTTMSKFPSTGRLRTRKVKTYSRYVEDESNQASFTASGGQAMKREPSSGSSASSGLSKQSIDESLTGLSCFGVIGSGTPGGVFGCAVISASRVTSGEQKMAIKTGPPSHKLTLTSETNPPEAHT